ncbi:22281_t:CDS:2 [Entrophospora sp. SA101]|nr:2951_t:CDS:2 [Entrophospora sp. SA101]CAJ0748033.1 22281_t:CDS:2 [Entrophospora sp. SA101]CAJ0875498.1 9379_t:CDS:2 [Entrophospora sp. SA101]
MSEINIAIDGPAGSGKTTLGKNLAQKINYQTEKVISICSQQKEEAAKNPAIFLQGLERQKSILSQPAIGNLASQFAPIKELRLIIYQLIRSLAKNKGFVVSGRDITFKVLPEAEVKIFLTADLPTRAKRRQLQLQNEGKNLTLGEVEKDLKERDQRDQVNISAAEATG